MVSDLLGSRRFPSKVQLTMGMGSPSAAHESSTSDPTRIVEFFGAAVITGGSEAEIKVVAGRFLETKYD